MQKISNTLNFVHFADDSTAFCDAPNAVELMNNLNPELIHVDNWLISNKLSLNLLKMKYMMISHT